MLDESLIIGAPTMSGADDDACVACNILARDCRLIPVKVKWGKTTYDVDLNVDEVRCILLSPITRSIITMMR